MFNQKGFTKNFLQIMKQKENECCSNSLFFNTTPIITSDGSLDKASASIDGTFRGIYIPYLNYTTPPVSVVLGGFLNFQPFTGTPPTYISFDNIEVMNALTGANLGSSTIKNYYFPKLKHLTSFTTVISLPVIENMFFPELETISGTLNFGSMSRPDFTNIIIDFPKLLYVGDLTSSAAIIPTANLPVLKFTNSFSWTANGANSFIDAPQLEFVNGAFTINSSSAVSAKFPSLETVASNFGVTAPSLLSTPTSFDFNKLKLVGGIFNITLALTFVSRIYNLAFPSLEEVIGGTFNFTGPRILSVDVPNIVSLGRTVPSININVVSLNTPALTDFTFGPTLKNIGNTAFGGNVLFSSCALNQVSVDNILIRLAALDGTNGTNSFNNRSVTIGGTSATPSAAGLVAVGILQARGCTVITN